MLKTPQLRGTQGCGLQQRSVAQAVGDDTILASGQCGNHRLVGGKTGDKQQRALIAEPVRQLCFQAQMRLVVTGDLRGAAAANAVTLCPVLPGANHLRVLAKAQIIVAGKIAVTASFARQPAPCPLRQRLALTKGLRFTAFGDGTVDSLLPAHTAAAL